MKYEHKAIIDAATREGKAPSELAKELLGHDLLKAMVTSISKPAVAFSKMSEQQQEAVIEDLKKELLPALNVAIGVICSQNTHTIRMKLKKMAVGKDYQITGQVDKTQDFIHELMDKTHDQSDVLIVLHERDYVQALDGIKGEKDQKALELGGEDAADKKPKTKRSTGTAKAAGEIAAKVIELPPGLVEQAAEFVRKFQTATHAGLQNHLKIGFEKADALLVRLEADGLITEPDAQGVRQLVREKPETKNEGSGQPAKLNEHDLPAGADGYCIMSDELYARAKAKVIKDQSVSAGGLAIAYDLDDTLSADLLDRLELDGVISEANDLGGREVLQLA